MGQTQLHSPFGDRVGWQSPAACSALISVRGVIRRAMVSSSLSFLKSKPATSPWVWSPALAREGTAAHSQQHPVGASA